MPARESDRRVGDDNFVIRCAGFSRAARRLGDFRGQRHDAKVWIFHDAVYAQFLAVRIDGIRAENSAIGQFCFQFKLKDDIFLPFAFSPHHYLRFR